MSNKLTPELHKQQIEAYTKQYPDYVTYAKALRRVLENACAASLPEALFRPARRVFPALPRSARESSSSIPTP